MPDFQNQAEAILAALLRMPDPSRAVGLYNMYVRGMPISVQISAELEHSFGEPGSVYRVVVNPLAATHAWRSGYASGMPEPHQQVPDAPAVASG
jgi:hypothetical protein